MGWLGRNERRRSPRPPGAARVRKQEPTYLVERDAPDWRPPMPYFGQWRHRAAEFVKRVRWDAYPDHAQPFGPPPDEPPVDVEAVRKRISRPKQGRLRLMVVGRKQARVVPLAGAKLEGLDFRHRLVAGWLASEIARIVEELRDEE
jgi:hypothetical protein